MAFGGGHTCHKQGVRTDDRCTVCGVVDTAGFATFWAAETGGGSIFRFLGHGGFMEGSCAVPWRRYRDLR